jgi:peptidoglycan/LPS O-acetylase OafA/YrhL
LTPQTNYIPTLDGWRAIAVTMVIAYHGTATNSPLAFLANEGHRGVNIFFGISGFLICTKLLEERERRGRISLKSFYTRRVFRILPPALLYVGVIALLGTLGLLSSMPTPEWSSCLFFFRNYLSPSVATTAYTGHYWSLSVEEHFYLFFPGLLVALGRRRAKWAVPALALAVALWRTLDMRYGLVPDAPLAWQRTDRIADGLLWGCAFALWMREPAFRDFLRRQLTPAVWLALLALYVATWYYPPRLSGTVEGVLVPLLLLSTILGPETLPGRFLELPALRWVGRLSYSLYLWQTILFVGRYYRPNVLQTFPLNLCLLLACASVSYHLVERPLTSYGHKMSKSRKEAFPGPPVPLTATAEP